MRTASKRSFRSAPGVTVSGSTLALCLVAWSASSGALAQIAREPVARGRLAQVPETAACPPGRFAIDANSGCALDWRLAFDGNGRLRDALDRAAAPAENGVADVFEHMGGFDAVLIEDGVSSGTDLEMTAVQGTGASLAGQVVDHARILPAHDVGNTFVLASDEDGEVVLQVRVERLSGTSEDPPSYVEVELNQARFRLLGGTPWLLHGERVTNDVVVRLSLAEGQLASAEVKRWADGAFETTSKVELRGERCASSEQRFEVCGGLLAASERGYIRTGDPIEPPSADAFLDFKLNLAQTLGAHPAFSTIQVRTPEDIALAFTRLGTGPPLATAPQFDAKANGALDAGVTSTEGSR